MFDLVSSNGYDFTNITQEGKGGGGEGGGGQGGGGRGVGKKEEEELG